MIFFEKAKQRREKSASLFFYLMNILGFTNLAHFIQFSGAFLG